MKSAKLHYYALTFIIAVFFYSRTGFRPLWILDHMYSGYGVDGHITILAMSFVVAFILRYKDAHLSRLYPFFVASSVYLIIPIIALIINFDNRYIHSLMYYIPIGFFFIMLPHLTIATLGLVFGTMIKKWSS